MRGQTVLSLVTLSQIKIHQPFGGVVPEIASRSHLEWMNTVLFQALADAHVEPQNLDGIAVTCGPGLVGALLVGVSAAKALAYAYKKPVIPVHHLEGHAVSPVLDTTTPSPELPQCLAIVSGGHTQLLIDRTGPAQWAPDFLWANTVARSRDDAAGEAFDKSAKLLGFPYPGGAWIDRKAREGNPRAFSLPRPLPEKSIPDFSFSGLKTAISLEVQKLQEARALNPAVAADLAASVQEAIVDMLMRKIRLAVANHECRSLALVGGVAANSRLRSELQTLGIPVSLPLPEYCTDNAAMIALAGRYRFEQGRFLKFPEFVSLNAVAYPKGPL